MRNRPILQMLGIGVVASIVGVIPLLLLDWFPIAAAEEAAQVDLLYYILVGASWPIFVLVMTIAIYSVVKFRARPGDTRDGEPIHGNAKLEILWITVPFLLVVGLMVPTFFILQDIEEPKPDTLVVDVQAEQFTWTFSYPEGGSEPVPSTELNLPAGRPVEFRISTRDVIHSFWVPEFRLKSDAVPGITTTVRLIPSREGTYDVVCAELCGAGHSTMRQTVNVMPEDEFTAWLSDEQEALAAEEEGGGETADAGGGGSDGSDDSGAESGGSGGSEESDGGSGGGGGSGGA
jgi:cytochrome c oxidase subunit 2